MLKNYDKWKSTPPKTSNYAHDVYLLENEVLISEYNEIIGDKEAHIDLVYSLAMSLNLASFSDDAIDVYNEYKDSAFMEQAFEVMREKLIDNFYNSLENDCYD